MLALLAALESPLVPELLQDPDQLDGVHVVNTLTAGVVAEHLVVSGQTEHVAYAKRISAQQVALHSQAVTVTADHLQVGLKPHGDQFDSGGPTGETGNGSLVVC